MDETLENMRKMLAETDTQVERLIASLEEITHLPPECSHKAALKWLAVLCYVCFAEIHQQKHCLLSELPRDYA